MKRKSTMFTAMLLSLTVLTACGGGTTDGSSRDGTDIVVYAGGSSEFVWSKGTKEDEVIDYIEQKYYEDTGAKINFKINFEGGKNMKSVISKDINEGKVDVVISHTSGGDGIDDFMVNNNLFANLRRTMDSYDMLDGDYFTMTPGTGDGAKTFDGLQRLTTEDNQIIGIPSMISPYKFGILVRKDWMEACGYTDDPTDTEKILVDNFETFTEMAVAMKAKYNRNGDTDYVMTGAMFDFEKAGLLGACGLDAGYYTNTVYKEASKAGCALQTRIPPPSL